MKDYLRILSVFVVFSFVMFPSVSAFAANQSTMTLEEVEHLIDSSPNKEVNAYFKSVERGTNFSTYKIILRGVHREPGLKVIMFVISGKIVAGMSGSPVYVDGKLVGALAYSFNRYAFSDYSWGGISPISLMTEEAKSGREGSGAVRTFNYKGMDFEPIAVGSRSIPGLESVVGGKFMVTTSSTGSSRSTGTKSPLLKAGMPIIVDLVEWTDEKGETTTISAMGTITRVGDDGKVFAFGHPFLNSRNVVYGFRTAEVMGTVYSQESSYKLSGKTSNVLGAITLDGAYGIYGLTSLDKLKEIHHFNLEFKTGGKLLHRFDIKVADSILTPLLAQAAFKMIGEANGAPLPQEPSVTQLEARVELEGYKPVVWKELFSSESVRFGPTTIYTSSYNAAYETFFAKIYSSLSVNNYGIKISNVLVSVNFIPGKSQIFTLGAYKFPNKVIYGEDPILEVLFVDRDNLMSIAKKIPVRIDWDSIERPVYAKDTLDTDKAFEKIVQGSLRISSAMMFFRALNDNEKQKLRPKYFLGAEDFLEKFSLQLGVGNQKIFVKILVKSRSGLFDDEIAKAEDLIPADVTDNTGTGWYVIKGELKERKMTVKNEGVVIFYLDLPRVPDGYVVDQTMDEGLLFEVVLDR